MSVVAAPTRCVYCACTKSWPKRSFSSGESVFARRFVSRVASSVARYASSVRSRPEKPKSLKSDRGPDRVAP